MIGAEQLQVGIYNQLVNEGLQVYPYVPDDVKYPFVALGEEYLLDSSTKNKRHFEIFHVIHSYSKSKNKKQINELNSKVINALDKPFPLGDGFYISNVKLDHMQTMSDPNAVSVFHGVLRFKFEISKG